MGIFLEISVFILAIATFMGLFISGRSEMRAKKFDYKENIASNKFCHNCLYKQRIRYTDINKRGIECQNERSPYFHKKKFLELWSDFHTCQEWIGMREIEEE